MERVSIMGRSFDLLDTAYNYNTDIASDYASKRIKDRFRESSFNLRAMYNSDNGHFDCHDESHLDIFICNQYAYSHKMKRVIALVGNQGAHIVIAEEVLNGAYDEHQGVKDFVKGFKGIGYVKNPALYNTSIIKVPLADLTALVYTSKMIINSVDSIENIGHQLLTGEFKPAEFELIQLDNNQQK